jgi:16S rRNA (cytosine967-C5)-methyltransferase
VRGIEASLRVWKEVAKGAFASEALRIVSEGMSPEDRRLASLLVYGALRRRSLWRNMVERRLKRPFKELKPVTRDGLIIGAAALMELRNFRPGPLYGGLSQCLKAEGAEDQVPILVAVLKRIEREGAQFLERLSRSSDMRDLALYHGLPAWAANLFRDQLGAQRARELVRLLGMRRYTSFFVDPSRRASALEAMGRGGIRSWEGGLDCSIRTCSYGFPPEVPGYGDGTLTPMSESSMWIVKWASALWRGGPVLDMCSGRGLKGAALLTLLKDVELECWDKSFGRTRAAQGDLERRSLGGRGVVRCGDALELEPLSEPSLVMLDAPCSGSGTWGRHPEGKWRVAPEDLEALSSLQVRLLERACGLIPKGGRVIYSTCSLFREENERVVGDVLSRNPQVVEEPIGAEGRLFVRGRPFGTYIWPGLPWVDGFYCAVLYRRG